MNTNPEKFEYVYFINAKTHLGNVGLSYTGDPQVVVDADFSSSTAGFIEKGLDGATYSAVPQYGD